MKRMLMGTAAVALLTFSQPVQATLVTDATNSITYNSNLAVTNGATGTNLRATTTFSDFDFTFNGTNTVVTFDVDVANTTQQGTLSNSDYLSVRLVGFAYNTDPDVISATDTSLVYNSLVKETFPSFNTVDVCVIASPQTNNCSGGSNGGLSPEQDTSFTQTLTFAGNITEFDFGIGTTENLAVRFQTEWQSYTFSNPPGGNPPPPPPPPPPVPEPGSLVLLMSGLAGLGGWFGFRRIKPTA